jgi:methyl-accepting chemotaxis protein
MSIPKSPGELIRWTARTTASAAAVPGRVLDLLSMAESVVARADELIGRTERVVTDAEGAVAHAREVVTAAEKQVAAARPVIEFAKEFSAHEVQAAIKLVDELPRLSQHLNDDVLPILGTLNRVGPDIHELLDVVKDLRQAIQGIPGFDFLRRRGEDKDT